jgi:hypothetical protein
MFGKEARGGCGGANDVSDKVLDERAGEDWGSRRRRVRSERKEGIGG